MQNLYVVRDEFIEISLSTGSRQFMMLINQEDFSEVSKSSWSLSGLYGVTHRNCQTIFCHRLIMNPSNEMVVDHLNGDTLDNRRKNLRIVTHRENLRNRPKLNINNKSGYPGVFLDKQRNKWRSYLHWDGKNTYCGIADTPEEAHQMRLDVMRTLDLDQAVREGERYAA